MGSRSTRFATVLVGLLLVSSSVLPGVVAGVDAGGEHESDVRTAIEDSREHLLSEQEPSGRWESPLLAGENESVNVRQTLYYALMLHHLGVEPGNESLATEWVLSRRRPDGGWNDTDANFAAILLLSQQDADYSDVIADIRRENERRNFTLEPTGSAIRTPSRKVRALTVLMSDRYEAEDLFRERTMERARYRLEAMSAMYEAYQHREEPDLDELGDIPEASNRTGEEQVDRVPRNIDTELSVSMLIVQLSYGEEEADLLDKAETVLLERRLPSGAWAVVPDTSLGSIVLYERGHDPEGKALRLTRKFLSEKRMTDDGRLTVFRIPLWDTAWAVRSLRASGLDKHHEAIEDGAVYLYEGRIAPIERLEDDPPLDRWPLQFRAIQGDGWGYKPYAYADWDDTAAIIPALAPYGSSIVQNDVQFLLRAQFPDGSWTGYTAPPSERRDETSELVESLFESSYETEDPSPDVTGHSLMALAATGYTVDNNASVRAAVDWFRRNQRPDGLWGGVWGEGLTYGTSRGVRGMVAVGVSPDAPVVQDAVEGMIARQNPDGSWGPDGSSPTHTAWALQTLLAGGTDPGHPAVQAGLEFLLDTQRTDGSWERGKPMKWRTYEYSLTVFTQAAALQALVMYADAADIEYAPDDGDDGDESSVNLVPIVGLGVPGVGALLALAIRRRS